MEPIDLNNWLMFFAAKHGNAKGIGRLFKQGVNLDQRDTDGSTPLFYAVWFKNFAAADALLTLGAKVNVYDENKESPLFVACAKGSKAIAELLLARGAKPRTSEEAQYATGFSLGGLDFAGCLEEENSRAFLSAKILAHALDIRGDFTIAGRTLNLEWSYSPLMFLPLAESLEELRSTETFERFSLKEQQRQKLQDALLLAYSSSITSKERLEVIQNSDIAFLSGGWTGHIITLAFFGEYMAVCNTGEGGIEKGKKTIEVFKIARSRLDASLLDEIKAMKSASYEEGVDYFYNKLPGVLSPHENEIVKDENCLLYEELSPLQQTVSNCAFASKEAALRVAWAAIQNVEPSEKLINKWKLEGDAFRAFSSQYLWKTHSKNLEEAGMNYVTLRRFNAGFHSVRYLLEQRLHKACKKGWANRIETLLALGGDPNWKDSLGRTALHWAAMRNDPAIAETLLNANGDLSTRDNIGQTPLHLAAGNVKGKDMVALLLRSGVEINAQDLSENTPLELALSHEAWDVVDLLEEQGATDKENIQHQSPKPLGKKEFPERVVMSGRVGYNSQHEVQ